MSAGGQKPAVGSAFRETVDVHACSQRRGYAACAVFDYQAGRRLHGKVASHKEKEIGKWLPAWHISRTEHSPLESRE